MMKDEIRCRGCAERRASLDTMCKNCLRLYHLMNELWKPNANFKGYPGYDRLAHRKNWVRDSK